MTTEQTTVETTTPAPTPAPQSKADRLAEALLDVVTQTCGDRDGRLDSYAISAYSDAMRLLDELRLIKIESQAGRRIFARRIAHVGDES